MKKSFVITVLSLLLNNSINAQQNPFPGFYEQTKANFANQLQSQHDNDSIKYYKLDIEKLNDYVFDALNVVRVSYGLKKFNHYENIALIDSCDSFANYLVTNDLLGHGTISEICYAGGAELSSTLKNNIESEIYKKLANDMVDGWMNSTRHKAEIVTKSYTKVIVSTAKDDIPGPTCGFDLRGVIRFYY